MTWLTRDGPGMTRCRPAARNAGFAGGVRPVLLAIQAYHARARPARPRRVPDPLPAPTAPTQRRRHWPACGSSWWHAVPTVTSDTSTTIRAKVAEPRRSVCRRLMITYPSTHGVSRARHRRDYVRRWHDRRAARCMSTAAKPQCLGPGWPDPGRFGGDVSHLNICQQDVLAFRTAEAAPAWVRWRCASTWPPYLPGPPRWPRSCPRSTLVSLGRRTVRRPDPSRIHLGLQSG